MDDIKKILSQLPVSNGWTYTLLLRVKVLGWPETPFECQLAHTVKLSLVKMLIVNIVSSVILRAILPAFLVNFLLFVTHLILIIQCIPLMNNGNVTISSTAVSSPSPLLSKLTKGVDGKDDSVIVSAPKLPLATSAASAIGAIVCSYASSTAKMNDDDKSITVGEIIYHSVILPTSTISTTSCENNVLAPTIPGAPLSPLAPLSNETPLSPLSSNETPSSLTSFPPPPYTVDNNQKKLV